MPANQFLANVTDAANNTMSPVKVLATATPAPAVVTGASGTAAVIPVAANVTGTLDTLKGYLPNMPDFSAIPANLQQRLNNLLSNKTVTENLHAGWEGAKSYATVDTLKSVGSAVVPDVIENAVKQHPELACFILGASFMAAVAYRKEIGHGATVANQYRKEKYDQVSSIASRVKIAAKAKYDEKYGKKPVETKKDGGTTFTVPSPRKITATAPVETTKAEGQPTTAATATQTDGKKEPASKGFFGISWRNPLRSSAPKAAPTGDATVAASTAPVKEEVKATATATATATDGRKPKTASPRKRATATVRPS